MSINSCNNISFKSNPIINATAFIEERVFFNKAILDGSRDVSIVYHCNNKYEAMERARQMGIMWLICFASPFVTLPLTNRLAMKYIAKLSPSFFSDDNQLIKLSYKYLKDKELTKKGIEVLGKKYDFKNLLKKQNYDYEAIRNKIINAKTSVLAFDSFFTAGIMGGTGFLNRYLTRKKTGKDGFSAEFSMVDKDIVENRAQSYKKTEKLRNNIFLATLLMLTAFPLTLKKGLNSSGKMADFIKKHADKFDYNDGIFMKRLPFFLMTFTAMIGMICASRNQTELKDNIIRRTTNEVTYFGGDIVIASALASISDKIFKTQLIDKNCEKNFINKIIPPVKNIKDLQGKNKAIATGLFWVNMATLFYIMGVGIPNLVNKMIKKDVQKDAKNNEQQKYIQIPTSQNLTPRIFEQFSLSNS